MRSALQFASVVKWVALIAAAVLVGLRFAPAASTAAPGGLHGRACRGPIPSNGQTSTCAKPQRLVFLLILPGRRYVVRSAADGAYHVTLPAGVYRAQLPVHVGINVPRLRPQLVRVRAGHDDHLDFYLDVRTSAEAVH